MPRSKLQSAAQKPFSEKQSIAVLQATIRDLEQRHAQQIAERDAYVERVEKVALDAKRQRNEIEQQLVDLLGLRKINAAAVLPGAFAVEVIETAVRRTSLALAAGDVTRAHRALSDTIASAKVQTEKVTEATPLSQTDLFEIIIESALERMGIVTCGDLVSASEEELFRMAKGTIGQSLGRSRLPIVLDARRKLLRVLHKSADAMATRRATA